MNINHSQPIVSLMEKHRLAIRLKNENEKKKSFFVRDRFFGSLKVGLSALAFVL